MIINIDYAADVTFVRVATDNLTSIITVDLLGDKYGVIQAFGEDDPQWFTDPLEALHTAIGGVTEGATRATPRRSEAILVQSGDREGYINGNHTIEPYRSRIVFGKYGGRGK